jgi:RNA polymerase sigma-70 factor (ECF subfamily)
MDTEDRIRALLAERDLTEAATIAIRELGPGLLRYLRAVLRDEADAQDAFSELAERLWRGIGRFEGRSSFRTWALRLASNTAMNLRAEAWRKHGRRFESGEASALAARVTTATALRVEAQQAALEHLRGALTLEEQNLLTLRIDQGLPWAEVAEVMADAGGRAPSVPTLTKRYERLRERLAKLASDEGLLP